MFMPVLASCFILVIAIAIAGRKGENSIKEKLEQFQERERAANEVRKQPIDDLEYLVIPEEFFGYPSDESSHDASEARHILENLKSEKIVNLTGISNTDLKLRYGVANLPDLMRFDTNYTSLVRALQMYAVYLSDSGYETEAIKLLEYAVESRSDVSASYKLLGELYVKSGQKDKLKALIGKAQELDSPMSKGIIRKLEEL
jgi:tetratricopeptide (TPR) repeat protein